MQPIIVQPEKRKFLEDYYLRRLATNDHVTKLVVAVKLPTGGVEIIINSEEIKSKVAYYDTYYDDYMRLTKNTSVSIIAWMFV